MELGKQTLNPDEDSFKGLEIEKKYLILDMGLIDDFIKDSDEPTLIEQGYIKIKNRGESSERIRKEDDKYTFTVKSGSGLVREEDENEITEEEYKKLSRKLIGRWINKKRYYPKSMPGACLDIFEGSFKGLYMLEVEFENIEQANNFMLEQKFFSKVIDVTLDNRYTNLFISQHGLVRPKMRM
jgi:adenylate cyclase